MPDPTTPPAGGHPPSRPSIPINREGAERSFGEQRTYQAQFLSDELVYDRSTRRVRPLSEIVSRDGGQSEMANFAVISARDTNLHSHSTVLDQYEQHLRQSYSAPTLKAEIETATTREMVRLNAAEFWKDFKQRNPQYAAELITIDPYFQLSIQIDDDALKHFMDALSAEPEYAGKNSAEIMEGLRAKAVSLNPSNEQVMARVANRTVIEVLTEHGLTPEQAKTTAASAIKIEGVSSSVSVNAEKLGPLPKEATTQALDTMRADLQESETSMFNFISERSLRRPYASRLSADELRVEVDKIYNGLPEGGLGRRLLDRTFENPNLRVYLVKQTEATGYVPGKDYTPVNGFAYKDKMYIALEGPNATSTLLEEGIHDLIGRTYENFRHQPYAGANDTDPRKALLESAIEADRGRTMVRDLHLEGYPLSTYHAEIPAKILVLKAQGKWTPELAERYSHIDQFIEKIILPDIELAHAKQPVQTIDVAQYTASLPEKAAKPAAVPVRVTAVDSSIPPANIAKLKEAGYTVADDAITAPGEKKPIMTKNAQGQWDVADGNPIPLLMHLTKDGPLADTIEALPRTAYTSDVNKAFNGSAGPRMTDRAANEKFDLNDPVDLPTSPKPKSVPEPKDVASVPEKAAKPAAAPVTALDSNISPANMAKLKEAGYTVTSDAITAPGETKPIMSKNAQGQWDIADRYPRVLLLHLTKDGPLADMIEALPRAAYTSDVNMAFNGSAGPRLKDRAANEKFDLNEPVDLPTSPKPNTGPEESRQTKVPGTDEGSSARKSDITGPVERPPFHLGQATSTGIALAGLGKGIIQQYQNGPDAVGSTLLTANAGLLATNGAEAVYTARAEKLLKLAGQELDEVSQAARLMKAGEAFGTAGKLKGAAHMGGNALGAIGVVMDIKAAVEADNTFSRVGNSANAVIGVSMLAVGGEAAGALAYVGPAGAVAAVAIGGAVEINEAWQEGVRNIEASNKSFYDAKVSPRYLGSVPGLDAEKLAPHFEEYQQLSVASIKLKETDPVKLRARIEEEITRLEATPGYAASGPSFVKDVIGTDPNRPETIASLEVRQLKGALAELGTPGDETGKTGEGKAARPTYFSRVAQFEQTKGRDSERAAFIETQLDRMNELATLRVQSQLSPERIQQEVARDMRATDLELGMLKEMSPAERDTYLRDNENFLRDAGIAPYSPLAQSMLTYDNLIEKAASIGIPAKDLEEMGFQAEVAGARAQNTRRLEEVVTRMEKEGKLDVDDKTLNFHHLNMHLGKEATPNDRAEYEFARSKLGIPARLGSQVDRDILATTFGKVVGNDIVTTLYTERPAVKDAEAQYLKDHPAAAQCVASGLCETGLEYFSRFGAYKGDTYGGIGIKDLSVSPPMDMTENSLNQRAAEITRTVSAKLNGARTQQLGEERKAADAKEPKQDVSDYMMQLFIQSKLGVTKNENGKPCVGIICEGAEREQLISELNKRNIPFKEVREITVEGFTRNNGGLKVEWNDMRTAGADVLPEIVKSRIGLKITTEEAGINRGDFSLDGIQGGQTRSPARSHDSSRGF